MTDLSKITWKDGTAYIGELSIGEVYVSEVTGEHWYGYVEGIGRIGTCATEDDAKGEVERLWRDGR